MNKRKSLLPLRAILVLVAFVLYGCGSKPVTTASIDDEVVPLPCVVVLPTQTPYKKSLESDNINNDLRQGADFLDRVIPEALQSSKVNSILDTSQMRGSLTEIRGGRLGAMKEIGEKLSCNVVLYTTLSRFKQRQGGELAVDAPASTAFEMQLVDVSKGSILWNTAFSETQTSLFENLFSFSKAQRRGFKWITVEDLTNQGIREKLAECPYFY